MSGAYRGYFHIGKIGIKYAKLDWNCPNTFTSFLVSIIMNILEYKRYKYYVLRKPMKQWGTIWKYKGENCPLCPVHFSFGLFNIVSHCEETKNKKIKSLSFVNDVNDNNIMKYKGKNVYVDYGDFCLSRYCATNIKCIDYK